MVKLSYALPSHSELMTVICYHNPAMRVDQHEKLFSRRISSATLALFLLYLSGSLLAVDYDHLRAGEGINILSNYGYLYMGLHVLPNNDSEPWLIAEDTYEVFKNFPWRNTSLGHKGDFHMDFCSSVDHLLRAYFRNFTIEGLPRPWRTFTSSWNKAGLARRMGISENYVSNRYNYVLVRLVKMRTKGWIDLMEDHGSRHSGHGYVSQENSPELTEPAAREVASVVPGDIKSVGRFIKRFGTHYVSSYTTGDTVYQVFVYNQSKYARIQEMRIERNVSEWPREEIDRVFSPDFADHTGKVMIASGNSNVEDWIENKLEYIYSDHFYENILKLHKYRRLKRELLSFLEEEAILQLNLKMLSPAFHDNLTRSWFEEIVHNRLLLWDAGM